jgi:hypothetical protein
MIRSVTLLTLLSVFGLLGGACSAAADPPPDELLDAIFPVLRGKSLPAPKVVNSFLGRRPPDATCGMARTDLVQSKGRANRIFELLTDPKPDPKNGPQDMLIRLQTLAIDADGSRHAYHPLDPFGNHCTSPIDDPKSGICAIDVISNAEIHLYEHSRRISPYDGKPGKPNPAFLTAWEALWSEISARNDKWVDLQPYFGERTPKDVRLYYSKQTDRAVTFDTDIIPFKGNFPCQHKDSRGEYFVAATTKRETAAENSEDDACSTADYFDSMQIPFIVLPPAFGQIKIGDIAIGFAVINGSQRMVFGVVGDEGPQRQIGEASIAFAQQLRGSSDVIKNVNQADALQLEAGSSRVAALGFLVLGGTASMFGSVYSRQNIELVARTAFQNWSSNNPRRLQDCMSIAPTNPLKGE